MAQFYADENFPRPVVVELRRLGHDVLTAQEAGQGGQGIDDDTVLAYATGDGRAVLTQNRKHFIRLHNTGVIHAGIIVCTVEPDFPALASRIDSQVAGLRDLKGQLIRVNRPNLDKPKPQ